jgi:PAS domain S-box-containing protein
MQHQEKPSRHELIALLEESRRELDSMRARHMAWCELGAVGFLTLDCQGLIIEFNPQAAILLDGEREGLLHKPLARFVVPGAVTDLQAHLERVCTDGQRVSDEIRLPQVDDVAERIIRIDSRPWCEADGTHLYLSSLVDITERKRTERALRERSEHFELIAKGTCDAIWDWDVLNHRVNFSPRWKEMRGYALHEISDREEEWSNNIHPEDTPRVMAAVQDHFAGKTPVFSEEYRIRCKDGSWKWILDRGVALHDGSGRVVRMAGSESDITERKQAEAALRESESFYRQTLESIPGMVFTTRPDGDCDYVNRQWSEYTGIALAEHLGEGWSKMVHPEDWSAAFTAWRIGCADQTPYDLEIRIRRHDGVYEWFQLIGRPILDTEGRIVRWFGAAMNIQKLKQAQTALHDSQQRSSWALQAAGGGAWDWDLLVGQAWWSDEMYELWGVDAGTTMRLENSLERIVEADRESIGKAVEAAIADRSSYHSEFRIRHPQRGERWMASQGRLVLDDEGTPQRLLGLTFDITERKQAEQALAQARRAAEQRAAELEALLQAVPAAVWIAHDAECRHISGN